MADKWTVKYNPKTGEALYFDNKGNISFRPPEGYEAAPPPVPTRASIFGGKKQKPVVLKPSSKGKSKRSKRARSKRSEAGSKRSGAPSKRSESKRSEARSKTSSKREERSENSSKRSKRGGSKRSKGSRRGGSKKSKRKQNQDGESERPDLLELAAYGSDKSIETSGSTQRLSLNPKYKKQTTPSAAKLAEISVVSKDNSRDIFENKLADASAVQQKIQTTVPVYVMEEKYNFRNNYQDQKVQNDAKVKVWKWGPYAHNLGYFTAMLYVFFGAVSLFWSFRLADPNAVLPDNVDKFIVAPEFAGFSTLGFGIAMFIFERLWGLNRTIAPGSIRGIFYIVASGPSFFSYATIMPAVVSIITGVVNIFAANNNEVGKMKGGTYLFSYFDWEEDRGVYYLSMFYVAVNVIHFVFLYGVTAAVVILCFNDEQDPFLVCPSQAAPVAKGFGNMLNLNCALIIIPILRGLLTTAADKINSKNVFPIRKAIEFHQIIGSIVGISTAGHTAAHYINYAFASEQTIDLFGKAAWFTGAAIIVVMAVLYSGAHYVVKRANYEIFWNSHHTYTLFFLLLLAHGPRFWFWFIIPLIGLIAEKVKRHKDRMQRKVFVRSVEFNKPVININFSPERVEDFNFREGQYCYILCPQVSKYEWHPFSISSCRGDLERFGYVSLHIRVQDDRNSWTFMFNEYFRQVAGMEKAPHEFPQAYDEPFFYDKFHRFDRNGKRLDGLYAGPDGLPLIRIDGPFNAPCQVYNTFRDVILVGSGIGITPGAGVLRSILRYKWNKGFYPDTVRFAWCLRQSEAQSFAWFIELICDLMAQVKADREAGIVTKSNYLQINIYVTGAKKKDPAAAAAVPPPAMNYRQSFIGRDKLEKKAIENRLQSRRLLDDGWHDDVAATGSGPGYGKDLLNFDANNLFQLIQDPPIMSNTQATANAFDPNAPNRLEDIWVWNGRPDWEAVFKQTAGAAKERNQKINLAKNNRSSLSPEEYAELGGITSEVGVCFCGGQAIGKDLKRNTKKWSTKEIEFHLNQEFF